MSSLDSALLRSDNSALLRSDNSALLRSDDTAPRAGEVANLSRRAALAAGAGSVFLLAVGLPVGRGRYARAQGAPQVSRHATAVAAFLRIGPDGAIQLQNPFVEGGQGIDTAVTQIVAEEMDADPARFTVTCAPVMPEANIMFGDQFRITGGSMSVRTSYDTFRKLGATARAMLVGAAAERLRVPAGELTTEAGRVIHAASGRSATYGELAEAAARFPAPADAPVKDPARFRLIGQPVRRLDSRGKSTGAVRYGIDLRVDGMLQASVRHAPLQGARMAGIANEAAVRAMPGVHSVQPLPSGAVAVLADSFFRARRAAEALEVRWEGGATPADFSSERALATFREAARGTGAPAETEGDAPAALAGAARVVEAEYDAPYLAHAQLEPPSALAQFQPDGSLDLHVPNQAPDMYRAAAAGAAGLPPERVRVHSPPLGGFFGRHFLYGEDPFLEAIALARSAGRPVKVIWTREEEFRRDALRPLSYARFRAGLGADGMPVALHAVAVGQGPLGRHMAAFMTDPAVDDSVVEGIKDKPYAIPARRVEYVRSDHAVNIGFWRSVGHSMNDFFYESFLDELAGAAGRDPYEYRLALLAGSPRHANLLRAAADLSGGWRRGPFQAPDGTRRARGVAMASPFGSEVATIAEVSIRDGEVAVHDLWVAIDPGRIVNPAIIAAQVRSAAAIGLSSALLEEVVFENGEPRALNFDGYPILPPARMPRVHVRIVESGAPMGGIGEPGTPGVPPAVANAVAALTGQRIRSLPLAKTRFGAA